MLRMRVLTSTKSNGLLMKVLGTGLQGTQLVAGLGSEHDHRQVTVWWLVLSPP
jgi:hypothetical protein